MARSFADKLERLFATVRRPDGSAFSLSDVVAAVNEQGDTKLSASYLSELRTGRKDSPNVWVVNALARFFGQPIEYFVEDMEPVRSDGHRRKPVSDDAFDSLADRLSTLIKLAEPHGVSDPSDEQLARWMTHDGHPVDPEVIALARAGGAEVPAEALQAFAGYFDVPTAFLSDPEVARAMAPQFRVMRALRETDVRRIAMRASHLDPSDRERVADLVRRLTDGDIEDDDLDF